MPGTTYLPARESQLVTWSNNFDTLITASAATYGLTPAQATTYNGLHNAFVSAYQTANDPGTRTPSAIVTKNDAKEALIDGPDGIRNLVTLIQAYPGTTNTMRSDLGITIPDDEPTPIPPPAIAPDLSILSTFGRLIRVRLRDQQNPDRRGKPDGVQGATILYHVGDTAPPDPAQWTFALNSSKTVFDVEIPASVESGSKVHLVAFWFNARKESSPASSPENTVIGGSIASAA